MSDDKTKKSGDEAIVINREKPEELANENFSRKDSAQNHQIIRNEESWPKPPEDKKK